jgi:NifU-like protein involved in Fe-S cluster formation
MTMTATCREACCNVTPRLTVAELFERGFRRNRSAPLSIVGDPCADSEANTVAFSLDIEENRIVAVGFKTITCATLIAYCEYISEISPGLNFELAGAFTARDLIDSVPGVPALKRDRAVLAIAAFRAAILTAERLQRGVSTHESRVHLRHAAP